MSVPLIENATEANANADLTEDVVTITRAELDKLRILADDSCLRGLGTKSEDDAATRREEALTREIKHLDRKVTDLDSAYRNALRDSELATALAGKSLVAGAASQLIKLWRDDFDIYEESGEYKVSARDGRTVAQWVTDRLGGSDYTHFCVASARGGSGAKALSQTGASDSSIPVTRTLGEALGIGQK